MSVFDITIYENRKGWQWLATVKDYTAALIFKKTFQSLAPGEELHIEERYITKTEKDDNDQLLIELLPF